MIAPVLGLALAVATPAMVFKTSVDWVVTDSEANVLRRFSKLGELTPLEVAISKDGKSLAFTARERDGKQPLLFLWRDEKAVKVSVDEGYHAAPSFSPSGGEIVFVHHPSLDSGPVGMHGGGANAQLWLISLKNRTTRVLTDTPGCKGNPHFATASLILLNHNNCNGAQGLEVLALRSVLKPPAELLPFDSYAAEPRLAPNGTSVAFTSKHYGDTKVWIAELASLKQAREVTLLKGQPARTSLNWSSNSRYLFFVQDDQIKRFDTKTKALMANNTSGNEGLVR